MYRSQSTQALLPYISSHVPQYSLLKCLVPLQVWTQHGHSSGVQESTASGQLRSDR